MSKRGINEVYSKFSKRDLWEILWIFIFIVMTCYYSTPLLLDRSVITELDLPAYTLNNMLEGVIPTSVGSKTSKVVVVGSFATTNTLDIQEYSKTVSHLEGNTLVIAPEKGRIHDALADSYTEFVKSREKDKSYKNYSENRLGVNYFIARGDNWNIRVYCVIALAVITFVKSITFIGDVGSGGNTESAELTEQEKEEINHRCILIFVIMWICLSVASCSAILKSREQTASMQEKIVSEGYIYSLIDEDKVQKTIEDEYKKYEEPLLTTGNKISKVIYLDKDYLIKRLARLDVGELPKELKVCSLTYVYQSEDTEKGAIIYVRK